MSRGEATRPLRWRFGYWSSINSEELAKLLPFRYELIENEVDDDEFGYPLYNYLIKSK